MAHTASRVGRGGPLPIPRGHRRTVTILAVLVWFGCRTTQPVPPVPTTIEPPVPPPTAVVDDEPLTIPPPDPVPPPSLPSPLARRVDAGLRVQGVDGARLPDGDLLVVGGGYRLLAYRSHDDGVSFLPAPAFPRVAGLTPDVSLADGRVLVAYSTFSGEGGAGGEGEIHLLRSRAKYAFDAPRVVARSGSDPRLLPLGEGNVLCIAVEIGHTLVVHGSDDGGRSWSERSRPLIVEDARIEDGRAILLDSGEILFAYEHEPTEGGGSHLAVIRSADHGVTWSGPAVLWQPEAPADVEPGGFAAVDDALLFFLSSDEPPSEPGTSYAGARVRALVSHDEGRTWAFAAIVVDEPDQIVFGVFPLQGNDGIGLLTVRHWVTGERALAVYHLDSEQVDRLAHGAEASWSTASSDE